MAHEPSRGFRSCRTQLKVGWTDCLTDVTVITQNNILRAKLSGSDESVGSLHN
jgi:hypothetical protein